MSADAVKSLYSGKLNIEYGQFYIDLPEPDDDDDFLDPEEAFSDQANGVCGAAQAGKIFFVTGIQNGVIAIDVELHSSEPPLDQSYEDIVEVSFERGKSPVSLCEWACEETYQLNLEQGVYRVRYHILGMDKDYDEEDDWEAPVSGQRYLVQIWNAPAQKDAIVKQTSENAAYWHRTWGGGSE